MSAPASASPALLKTAAGVMTAPLSVCVPAATPAFRNSQGRLVDLGSIPASRAKSEFAAVLEQAALGAAVTITRHDKPKAVLLSYTDFKALVAAASPKLEALEAQWDGMLARMQLPAARRGMQAAFDASPTALGRAARHAATAVAAATATTSSTAARKR